MPGSSRSRRTAAIRRRRLIKPKPAETSGGLGAVYGNQLSMKIASKQTNMGPVQHQAHAVIGRIKQSLTTEMKYKAIRPFDLKSLGYSLDRSHKVIMSKVQELRRVLDDDTGREANLSFLLNIETNLGYVLPWPYSQYVESSDGGAQ
jgi:hypothetical protein